MPDSMVRRVITTVHGTFASKASWIQRDSKLGQALAARLGPGVTIAPFTWSGGNNPAARERAQQELRDHLRELRNQHDCAQQFIIAHSHGGNVALYAMRDDELRAATSGVVCLATPFIVARPRTLGSKDTVAHVAGAAVLLVVLAHLLAQWLLPEFESPWLRQLLLVIVLIGSLAVASVLLPSWRKYANRLQDSLAFPTMAAGRLLLIRAPGDEAGAGLGFVQLMSQVGVRLYLMLHTRHERMLGALVRWRERRGRVVAALVGGLAGYAALITALIAIGFPGMWGAAIVVVGAWVMIGVPAMVLAGWEREAMAPLEFFSYLVLSTIIFVLSLLLLPFGRQIAAGNIFLDVTAETTPPGEWTVHQLGSSTAPGNPGELQPLQHSTVYDDADAIRLICDWIERTPAPIAGATAVSPIADRPASLASRLGAR